MPGGGSDLEALRMYELQRQMEQRDRFERKMKAAEQAREEAYRQWRASQDGTPREPDRPDGVGPILVVIGAMVVGMVVVWLMWKFCLWVSFGGGPVPSQLLLPWEK